MREFTEEQRRAIDRRDGSLLVRAGAGTGKTSVLVERFVRAVLDDGQDVAAMLAITFTEKAAAEMKGRVRGRFIELGERGRARDAEGAWISTIHGFCARVLRAHALSAGIDPEFRVLEEVESERVGVEAFDRALEEFLAEGADPRRLEMAAAYTPDRLREMVRTAHAWLRSQGQRLPSLEPSEPRSPAGERERLATAAAAALRELGAAGGGRQVADAIARLERCADVLRGLANGALAGPEQLEKLDLAGAAKALATPVCQEYGEALEAYRSLCADHRGHLDHTLLRELLDLYGRHYERLKRARSGLDFEDLQLVARDLLSDHPGIRESYAGRFAHVLVDEFQDTNPLQNELLGLLERDNLFRVGDENQSIYGFRHADVDVFRDHHAKAAEAGRAEGVTVNFRSRGEVLDAVDLLFSGLWNERFDPLREREGSRAERARAEPPVELLVVDKERRRWEAHFAGTEDPFGAGLRTTPPWRACEARLVAKRVEELTRGGLYEPKDVVLLLRATTHMAVYERALEERGVKTHVVGGRGYWSQQQVADLRHWLAALANPLDELAVYSLLASPLVGVSLDALALIGIEARGSGRDAYRVLRDQGDLAERLEPGDRAKLEAFVRLFEGERRAAPQVSLETLIDRAVTRTGYDRHVLALPAGDRRMANVRKLMRMAREFEADEGRDLRAFIDFVAERDMIQSREGEAPLEAEELDAVRLMTVHRAKGLEFPVVVVADLGKDGREDTGSLRISAGGEVGLRLATMGGGKVDTAELERIKADQKRRAEEEERRIFYVAATRAQEHLVMSGATDLERRPEPGDLCEPMRWVWRGLCTGLPADGATGVHAGEWESRAVAVRWQRCAPDTIEELLSPADRAPARPAPVGSNGFQQVPMELGAVPAPRALPLSRLSYSALEAYRRCGYRFYLERVLGLPRSEAGRPPPREEPPEAEGLPKLLRGSLVHKLLEELDFRRPVLPSDEGIADLILRHADEARAEDVADLRALLEGFAGSELRERLARADRVRAELPFAFTLEPPGARGRSLLVNGVVDVHAVEGDRVLVVDYKSDPLEGREPDEYVAGHYDTQRTVYALAALKSGAATVEVAYVLLERPDRPVTESFAAADAARLELRLLELGRGLIDGGFEPAAEPHRELCAGCPGRPALCSWPPEMTLRAPPA